MDVIRASTTDFLDKHERIDRLVGKFVPEDWGNYFTPEWKPGSKYAKHPRLWGWWSSIVYVVNPRKED